MDFLAVLLTLLGYGLAGWLWREKQLPIFALAMLSGHLSALASPFWALAYGLIYQPELIVLGTLQGQKLQLAIVLASAWFYPLPALLTFWLYRERWWSPSYFLSLLTYSGFLFFYLLLENFGLKLQIWHYRIPALFGISSSFISASMAALVALGLLYLLLLVWRKGWWRMGLTLLPATLGLSLLVHGLLGAPFWIPLFVGVQSWAAGVGAISALVLLAWAVHITLLGLAQLNQRQIGLITPKPIYGFKTGKQI